MRDKVIGRVIHLYVGAALVLAVPHALPHPVFLVTLVLTCLAAWPLGFAWEYHWQQMIARRVSWWDPKADEAAAMAFGVGGCLGVIAAAIIIGLTSGWHGLAWPLPNNSLDCLFRLW